MRKILIFLLTSLLILTLVGCNKEQNVLTNLAINDNILTFTEVKNAESYFIYIANNKYETTENSYNLSTLNLSIGSYEITVTAVINGTESKHSKSILYEIKPILETEPLSDIDRLELLKLLDDSFELNLTKEDFATELSYYSYLRALSFVDSYDFVASESGITNEKKLLLFKHLYLNISSIDSFESALLFFDNATQLNLNKAITANFIYELTLTTYEMNYHLTSSSSYYEIIKEYRDTTFKQIEDILSRDEYINFYNNFNEVRYSELIDFYKSPFKYNEIYPNIIINDIMNGSLTINKDDFLKTISNSELIINYSKVYDAALSYTTDNDFIGYSYLFSEVVRLLEEYKVAEEALKGYEERPNLEDDQGYINITQNELELKQAFEEFFVFAQKLRPIASSELIELFVAFEFNQFTLNELYKHKNQITTKLLEALPSEEALRNLIYAIEMIKYSAQGNNNQSVASFTELAPLLHKTLTLIIETINEIPKDLFTEYKDLVENLKQQGFKDDEIINVVVSELTNYLVSTIILKISNEQFITKEEANLVFNYFVDFLIEQAKRSYYPNEIIVGLQQLKALFEPLYYLYEELGDQLFELINKGQFTINFYQNLSSLEGISKEEYLTLYEELNKNNEELFKIILPIVDDYELLSTLYDVISWLYMMSALTFNNASFPLSTFDKAASIDLFKNIIYFISSAYQQTNNLNYAFELEGYSNLNKYQLYRLMFLRLNIFVVEQEELFDSQILYIKNLLFESFFTEANLELSENEINQIKNNFELFIIDFKTEIANINNFDFNNLTNDNKLYIDNFILKYLN